VSEPWKPYRKSEKR